MADPKKSLIPPERFDTLEVWEQYLIELCDLPDSTSKPDLIEDAKQIIAQKKQDAERIIAQKKQGN
jgi:hypothetical protein